VVKEQEALVAGQKAKAQFEQAMEEERIILQQKRLMAEVIEPARARREAQELDAKAAAAPIIESGRARVEVLRHMIEIYRGAAGDGEKVFMLNMLPEIIAELVKTVDRINVDRVSVIDGGGGANGGGLGRLVGQFPAAVISLTEQIENATGVNILSAFGKGPESKLARETTARAAMAVEPDDDTGSGKDRAAEAH